MKPKLVILRGIPASGKSTAYANLRKNKKMKGWLFVDHCALKHELGKELGKKSLFAVLKVVMSTKKDIMIEEMSRETVMNFISSHIKKYNYEIVVFQFAIPKKLSKRRDVQRVKNKNHPRRNILFNLKEMHKKHESTIDKKGIVVDTTKLNKKQVVDFIIKKLK